MTHIKQATILAFTTFASLGSLAMADHATAQNTPKNAKAAALHLNAPKVIQYKSKEGEQITAQYFSLSDGSLNFVKLSLPDGKEYTLPQTVSASGQKFTDGFQLVWWTKGKTAFVQEPDDKGDWKTKFTDLTEAPAQTN